MNPFFFGDSTRALYGVHHPAHGVARAAGVVLCYPFAQEYMRAHRAFRQLSMLLSGEGFHALRFDYSGTGDSAGEPSDMSLARWDDDLATAIDELTDTAALGAVWVVGLRLGAVMALRAASRPEVRGIVLWDPIVSGQAQLEAATSEVAAHGTAVLELGGVPLVPQLRDDLTSIDLLSARTPRNQPCLVVVSDDADRYRALRDGLMTHGTDVTYRCIPSDGRWSEFDNWGSALIPQAQIRAIVEYLKQRER